MKAFVNNRCIACGICVGLCPEVFHIGEGGFAQAKNDVPPEFEEGARAAQTSCPASAIELEM